MEIATSFKNLAEKDRICIHRSHYSFKYPWTRLKDVSLRYTCWREDTPCTKSVVLLGWETQPRYGICMVLSFLFNDGYATHLPRCSRFILWICDAVALRYLRERPLIFTAIPNMLAHAEPILEKMHGGSFVKREYGKYQCDGTR